VLKHQHYNNRSTSMTALPETTRARASSSEAKLRYVAGALARATMLCVALGAPALSSAAQAEAGGHDRPASEVQKPPASEAPMTPVTALPARGKTELPATPITPRPHYERPPAHLP
jgi:hypothetical protein